MAGSQTANPNHSFPSRLRQFTLMLIALALTRHRGFAGRCRAYCLFLRANPYLNGVIIFVLLIGVIACFYQVLPAIALSGRDEAPAADR